MPFLSLRLLFLVICLSCTTFLIGCSQNSTHVPAPVSSITLPESHTSSIIPRSIALLLPLQGSLGNIGQAVKQGFLASAQENGTPPKIIIIDTTKEPSIQAAYSKAVDQEVQFVVGPLFKPEVQTLAGLPLSIPVLALNYLNPDISTSPELYQFGLSPLDEARQAALKAWQSGRRSALIMTSSGTWGSQIGQAFANQWTNLGGKLIDHLALSQNTSALTQQIRHFLQFKPPHDRRTDFDVIFLASDPKIGRQVKPLLKFFYAGDIPVYATASIYSGLSNSRRLDNDLNGVIFCGAPWTIGRSTTNSSLYEQLQSRDPKFFRRNRSYYALGIDAFHIVQQLPRLRQSPSQILPGATGQLTLNNQHRIVRELVCAQFRRGTVSFLN
ncbi:MAG: penicillin-binding protein activator [Pseudomonadota bacterium]